MTPEELKEVRATHDMRLKRLDLMDINDATNPTGPQTLEEFLTELGSLHTLAPEDHPIYKQGSTISAVNLKAL